MRQNAALCRYLPMNDKIAVFHFLYTLIIPESKQELSALEVGKIAVFDIVYTLKSTNTNHYCMINMIPVCYKPLVTGGNEH